MGPGDIRRTDSYLSALYQNRLENAGINAAGIGALKDTGSSLSLSDSTRPPLSRKHSVTIEFSTPSSARTRQFKKTFSFPTILTLRSDWEAQRISPNPTLALVIPCHLSAGFIKKTIDVALKHLLPEQIFVIDNVLSVEPGDKIQEIIKVIDERINYCYSSEIGNKSIAVFCVVHWARLNNYEKVLITDDDCPMPEFFKINNELLKDPAVKGLVYPILGVTESGEDSWLASQQNRDYKLAALELWYLDKSGAVPQAHGACVLYDTDALIEIMNKHNTAFNGEDAVMGLVMLLLKNDHGRYVFRIDMACSFNTC